MPHTPQRKKASIKTQTVKEKCEFCDGYGSYPSNTSFATCPDCDGWGVIKIIEIYCSNCDELVEKKDKFCKDCGSQFTSTTTRKNL